MQPTLPNSLNNTYMRINITLTTPSPSSSLPRGLPDPVFRGVRHSGLQGGQRQGLPPHRAHHCPHPGGGAIHRRPEPLQAVTAPQHQQGGARGPSKGEMHHKVLIICVCVCVCAVSANSVQDRVEAW